MAIWANGPEAVAVRWSGKRHHMVRSIFLGANNHANRTPIVTIAHVRTPLHPPSACLLVLDLRDRPTAKVGGAKTHRERSASKKTRLGTTALGSGNHLHRRSDLLDRLSRRNLHFEGFERHDARENDTQHTSVSHDSGFVNDRSAAVQDRADWPTRSKSKCRSCCFCCT